MILHHEELFFTFLSAALGAYYFCCCHSYHLPGRTAIFTLRVVAVFGGGRMIEEERTCYFPFTAFCALFPRAIANI